MFQTTKQLRYVSAPLVLHSLTTISMPRPPRPPIRLRAVVLCALCVSREMFLGEAELFGLKSLPIFLWRPWTLQWKHRNLGNLASCRDHTNIYQYVSNSWYF